MIVVSDTSAVSNLLTIHRESLLQRLFGIVIVPEAVRRELERSHSLLPDFIEVRRVRERGKVDVLVAEDLDPGEAEAIILAEELNADYLLIDESVGRTVARERGVQIIGLLGVLARAKRQEFISAVRPEIEALESKAGFWISARLRNQVLQDLGEA